MFIFIKMVYHIMSKNLKSNKIYLNVKDEIIKNSISRKENTNKIYENLKEQIENTIIQKTKELEELNSYSSNTLKEIDEKILKETLYFKKMKENLHKKYNPSYKSKFKESFEAPVMSSRNIKVRDRLKKHLLVEDSYIKNKKIFESINSEYKDFLNLIKKENININYNFFPKNFNFDNFKFLDISKLDYNDTLSYYSIVLFLSEIKLSYFSYKKLIKLTSSFDFIRIT